jgi:hypothetical protein
MRAEPGRSRGEIVLFVGMAAVIFVLFFMFSGEFHQRIAMESSLTSCLRALNEVRGGANR